MRDEQSGDDEVETKRHEEGPRVQRVDGPHCSGERDEGGHELKRRAPRVRTEIRPDHAAPFRTLGG